MILGKIVVSMFQSVDGRIQWDNKNERPPWSIIYWKKDLAQIMVDQVSNAGALLLGRITYENFSKTWPKIKDDYGYSKLMNDIPKYLISNTLTMVEWNNSTLIQQPIIENINELKETGTKDLLIFGSGELITLLMRDDLIDEFKLFVIPIIIGKGKQLFSDSSFKNVNLIESKIVNQNMIYLNYKIQNNKL